MRLMKPKMDEIGLIVLAAEAEEASLLVDVLSRRTVDGKEVEAPIDVIEEKVFRLFSKGILALAGEL